MKQNKTVLTAVILSGSLGLVAQTAWTQDKPGGAPGDRPPGQTIPDKLEPKGAEPKGAEPKAGQPAAMAKDDIKKMEEALKAKGHDPGPVDGVMDSKTQAALRAFQKANNLAETGVLDSQTAAKLGVQAGASTPGSKPDGGGLGGKPEGGGLGGPSTSPKGGETGPGPSPKGGPTGPGGEGKMP